MIQIEILKDFADIEVKEVYYQNATNYASIAAQMVGV